MRFAVTATICMLCFCCFAQAEQLAFTCKTPIAAKSAQELLIAAQRRYSQVSTLEAQFAQDSFMAALEVSERSKGTVWFKRPGMMKWSYSSPEPQVFLIRDQTMWFYQEREKQVLIDNFKDVMMSDLPVAFLMGIGNLDKSFQVESACSTSQGDLLTLTPRTGIENGNLQQLQLLLDKEHRPSGAKIRDIGGNTTSILFAEVKFDNSLEESNFAVNFPKGVDLSDRRLEKAPRNQG
ncbi:MAG: outer membrane lipoprotein chaperone LolA [Oligoflexia bacterium]|nr:outer membrane lipoprotein chaperone LolA [Oligoflexia bacterium]